MTESSPKSLDLEQLFARQRLPEPPERFAADLTERLASVPPPRPLWRHPGLQWVAIGLGFGFGLMRLASYVFGAWLAVTSAL